jgi:HSP20 family protein
MSIVRLNPWREFDDLFTHVSAARVGRSDATWTPVADILETADDYHIELDIPAVAAEAIDIALDDGVLTVSGERSVEDSEAARHLRKERSQGRFSRSFHLPENVDEDSITAAAKNGVLSLVITKKVKDAPRRIEIAAA